VTDFTHIAWFIYFMNIIVVVVVVVVVVVLLIVIVLAVVRNWCYNGYLPQVTLY